MKLPDDAREMVDEAINIIDKAYEKFEDAEDDVAKRILQILHAQLTLRLSNPKVFVGSSI